MRTGHPHPFPPINAKEKQKLATMGSCILSEPDKRGIHTWKRSQTRKNPTQKPLTLHQQRAWLNAAYYIDAFFKKGDKCPNWGEGRCTPELMRKIEFDIGWTEFEMKKSKGDTWA